MSVILSASYELTNRGGEMVLKNRLTGQCYGPYDSVPMPGTSYGALPATEAAMFMALSANLSPADETQLSNFRRMGSQQR